MKNYSIEKVGTDYVVKVDDQSVMKMGSRRRAAQLVVEAQELLADAPLAPPEAVLVDGNTEAARPAHDDPEEALVDGAV
jgi:hypothetical protein